MIQLPEFSENDIYHMMRISVEECRTDLAQKGEALLDDERIEPILERIEAGETCPEIAPTVGLSETALFVSLSDWNLRQLGY